MGQTYVCTSEEGVDIVLIVSFVCLIFLQSEDGTLAEIDRTEIRIIGSRNRTYKEGRF